MRRILLVSACALLLGQRLGGGRAAAEGEGVAESIPEAVSESAADGTTGSSTVVLPVRPSVREQNCLSPADMREVVAEKQVVEPVAAIRAARQALPKAEIVRANLCRHEGAQGGPGGGQGESLVYLITALRRDGHFVHVTIDARSGSVADLW